MKPNINKIQNLLVASLAVAAFAWLPDLRADEVTEWNQNAFAAIFRAGLSPLVTTRAIAIVQASVFDAANGVYNRYTPVLVPPAAANGASARAAVAQAAYGAL